MKELMVKEWMFNKVNDEAQAYNTLIDVKYIEEMSDDDYDMIYREDGYVTVYVEEELRETEKAVYVKLSTGAIDGSFKGWKCWLPKSVIKEVKEEKKEMKAFEIVTNTVEVKGIENIEEGMSIEKDGAEIIASFKTLKEAEKAFEGKKTKIIDMVGFYSIQEYFIEENVYDQNGELVEGGDIIKISKPLVSATECETYKDLEEFDNVKEAVKFAKEYENEYGVRLSFF